MAWLIACGKYIILKSINEFRRYYDQLKEDIIATAFYNNSPIIGGDFV